MTDAISIENAAIVAARLKEGRIATGLSTRSVAERLDAKFGVKLSHASIANYEKPAGGSSPSVRLLSMLAQLYERPLDWFLDKSKPLAGIRYRHKSSRVLVKERQQYEAQAQFWLEAYYKLERFLNQRLIPKKSLGKVANKEPVELAKLIRKEWDYRESDPIFSVVSILEDLGIRVIEVPAQVEIDGFWDSAQDTLQPCAHFHP